MSWTAYGSSIARLIETVLAWVHVAQYHDVTRTGDRAGVPVRLWRRGSVGYRVVSRQ